MNCIRLDSTYALSKLSRYTHNPSSRHWITLIRVLKVLKRNNKVLGLHFSGHLSIFEWYNDANWILILGGGAVS